MWQTGALNLFLPKRGQKDDPVPMLEVHYLEPSGRHAVAVIALALENFNEWSGRVQALALLGETWAHAGWQVLALRLSACAWIRRFSDQELQARGNRLIETYDDKQEVVLVQGKTLDGRTAVATAPILRDKANRVRATRPWEVRHGPGGEWRFEMGTLDVAWEAYLRLVVGGQGQVPDLHC